MSALRTCDVATGVATGLSGGLVLLYVWVVARRIRRHLHALQTEQLAALCTLTEALARHVRRF